MAQQLIGQFDIPEDMAKELSDLLARKTIKEDVMVNLAKNKNFEEFEVVENDLIPVIQKIEAIKNSITANYVPDEYKSEKYVWNYDGYEVDGCTIHIYTA